MKNPHAVDVSELPARPLTRIYSEGLISEPMTCIGLRIYPVSYIRRLLERCDAPLASPMPSVKKNQGSTE